jgi:hypothetical protein
VISPNPSEHTLIHVFPPQSLPSNVSKNHPIQTDTHYNQNHSYYILYLHTSYIKTHIINFIPSLYSHINHPSILLLNKSILHNNANTLYLSPMSSHKYILNNDHNIYYHILLLPSHSHIISNSPIHSYTRSIQEYKFSTDRGLLHHFHIYQISNNNASFLYYYNPYNFYIFSQLNRPIF